MKKLCIFFAAIMTAVTVWAMWSCGADPMTGVSERRSGFYTCGDGAYTVTAVSGVREEPYVLDGVAEPVVPYTLITVVPAEFDVDAVITYSATTDAGEYGGTLTVHPFAASFSAEFGAETAGALTVRLMYGGESREYVMTSLVTPEMLTYDRAVAAAVHELDPEPGYETRVRLIKNPIGGEGLCWHVDMYFASGSECGVLLDPVTARVLAKKTGGVK